MKTYKTGTCLGTFHCCVMFAFLSYVVFAVRCISAEPIASNDPIGFARQKLSDSDARVRGYALNVVGSLNPQAERERLVKALEDPSVDVQITALFFLKEVQLGENSTRIHLYLKKATEKAHAALATDPSIADSFICEMEAVEVFLAAGNDTDRRFAEDYIRRALSEKQSLPRWSLMADLVVKYRLQGLIPLLKSNTPEQAREVLLVLTLAKLGDEEAIKLLRESVSDKNWQSWVLRDPELVGISGLKQTDISPYLTSTSFDKKVAAAIALTRLGNSDSLHVLMRELWSGDSDDPSGEKYVRTAAILNAVGDVGDRSFQPSLTEYFEKSANVELKLQAAGAIAQIMAQQSRQGTDE